jgi:very-short-patch-repair endonuclease
MSKKENIDYEALFEHQLKSLKLTGWVREYIFHPTRKWRLDFYHDEKKIAVEIEGAIWVGGRHVTPQGYLNDMEKYNAAQMMGISVIRFGTHMIKNGEAIAQIERFLNE